MRPQRKRMIVETTRAFVKLKQNKAAVSAGGTKFGFHVMTFKEDHPTFSGIQLHEAIEEPKVIPATDYRMRKTEAKPGGIEFEDSIKPCEEEI